MTLQEEEGRLLKNLLCVSALGSNVLHASARSAQYQISEKSHCNRSMIKVDTPVLATAESVDLAHC